MFCISNSKTSWQGGNKNEQADIHNIDVAQADVKNFNKVFLRRYVLWMKKHYIVSNNESKVYPTFIKIYLVQKTILGSIYLKFPLWFPIKFPLSIK